MFINTIETCDMPGMYGLRKGNYTQLPSYIIWCKYSQLYTFTQIMDDMYCVELFKRFKGPFVRIKSLNFK